MLPLPPAVEAQHAAPLLPGGYALAQDLRNGHLARAQQQRLESLVQALAGEMSALDSRGKPVTVRSVTAALHDMQVEQMTTIRRRQAEQLQVLQARLEHLGQRIEKRSQVFQRSLLYDGLDRARLDAEVQAIRARIPHAQPVLHFLAGQQDLRRVCAGLLPLLPSYAESGRSLVELLASEPRKQHLVVQLLRNRQPFTPIDRAVEAQQGLRNRRDSLVVLEIPGGQDGPLAELMLREGIVVHRNQIVASGDDEIRLYTLRDGLPYAAISPLARYCERHNAYMENPAAITPYTVPNAHQLPRDRARPHQPNLPAHAPGMHGWQAAIAGGSGLDLASAVPEVSRTSQKAAGGSITQHGARALPARSRTPGRDLARKAREGVDTCADDLLKDRHMLHYYTYMVQGMPIATGVIEGACRHLIKDRMDITGARWGLETAEAILKRRSLRSSGDFAASWEFHKAQELKRHHTSRYPLQKAA